MLSRGIWLLLEKKEVIHAPEPSYEETALLLQTVGGDWASPPSAVLPGLGLPFITEAFPGKKGETRRSNNDQSSCPSPSSPLNAHES